MRSASTQKNLVVKYKICPCDDLILWMKIPQTRYSQSPVSDAVCQQIPADPMTYLMSEMMRNSFPPPGSEVLL